MYACLLEEKYYDVFTIETKLLIVNLICNNDFYVVVYFKWIHWYDWHDVTKKLKKSNLSRDQDQ